MNDNYASEGHHLFHKFSRSFSGKMATNASNLQCENYLGEEFVSNSESESESENDRTDSVNEALPQSPEKATASNSRKRRRAGELSGRQMAIRRLKKEGILQEVQEVPTFIDAVIESHSLLESFIEEEDEWNDDIPSAMRIYMCKKYGISSTVSNSL